MADDEARPGYLFVLPWRLDTVAGGVNGVVRNLYRQFEHHGVSPYVMELTWGQHQADAMDEQGFRVVRCEIPPPYAARRPLRTLAAFFWKLPRAIRMVRQVLRDRQIRHVNLHYPTPAGLFFGLARRLGLFNGSFIVSLHGKDIRDAVQTRGAERFAWGLLFRSADRIVCCAVGLQRELTAGFPAAAGKSIVIHNGVDEACLQEQIAGAGEPPDWRPSASPRILNIGTYEYKKGHDVLLEAFSEVVAQRPDAELVIIGRDADRYAPTSRLTEQLGLSGHVRLLHDLPHDQTVRMLDSCDLFVLPSRQEGFPLVLLEAGVLGTAIIASDIPGVDELIEHEVDGLLCDSGQTRPLAEGMLRLADDPALRRVFAERLQQKVRERFTWQSAAASYLELTRTNGR